MLVRLAYRLDYELDRLYQWLGKDSNADDGKLSLKLIYTLVVLAALILAILLR